MAKAEIRMRDLGHGRAALVGTFRNQMKRVYDIRALRLSDDERDNLSPPPEPFIEDRRENVLALLEAMANVAWQHGWRPAGLASNVAGYVNSYRLPKEEGPTDAKRKR